MTPAEYSALAHPRLSHPARSLYTLQLRRLVLENQLARLNYPELGRSLAVVDPTDPSGFCFQVNARQLTELFDELMEAGLLQVEAQADSEHYHQCPFQLPLLTQKVRSPLPERPFQMHLQWRPDEELPALARLCGVIDASYNEEDLGEFIAYWLGRPEVFDSQHQWMLKFIRALKTRRYVRRQPMEAKGYQQVTSATVYTGPSKRALEMMEEVKRLTEAKNQTDEE
ncbi:DnaT-like ssDNA-binding domain-containing protein [Aeromonas salmonicida]|uniref:DnaT-like ssDNA-binding domain-containing protein n=1 Tax=Aeromonas salmonicida TaxID=645 RepID=UPI00259D41D6|nr:DnaT-like ssDNA-binding domain-containing protein [Aeromonas salmonicida]MDM5065414.1 DnaT-like ssDNA-binding domain-containing protein [Aeromonas salmonicida]